MKLDVMVGGGPLRRIQDLARRVEAAGLDGLVVTEGGRTAYLSCAAAALAADIDVATGIAVAFPRSPMATAKAAWELADVTNGRFRLGLGTQVRAHIERRYSAPFSPPGPRMRDYVLALRAIFRAFGREEPLAHDGPYYSFNLLPDQWSPGPIDAGAPPVDVAAVNPWMLRMAGEVADGVHIHPLNTVPYLREIVLPGLAEGAARADRDPSELAVIVPCLTAVGDTDAEQARWREMARMQVAFYGSTPNYAFIFDQLGHEGTTARIRERQKAGDLAGMAKVVGDDLLEHFVVRATWDDLAPRLVERYGGVASRVVLYFAGAAHQQDPSVLDRFGQVARQVRGGVPGAGPV